MHHRRTGVIYMQKQKPEIEAIILEKAEIEFYQFGYEKASLRRIIKAAGVSIGNFYNYFESKSDLFDKIVHEEYVTFKRFMTEHESVDNPAEVISMLNADNIKEVLTDIIKNIMPDFNRKFVILAEAGNGSGYEHIRLQLQNTIKEHLQEHNQQMNVTQDENLTTLLATQFLEGMVGIIKLSVDDNAKRYNMLSDYFLFYFSGVMGLIGYKL